MFEKDVSLSRYSNYKIGGPARYFYEPKTVDELIAAIEKAKKKNLPIFVLGGGTNLLISDEGFGGLVVRPAFDWIRSHSAKLTVGAGTSIVQLLDFVIAKNLSGLEWAGGLPGLLGGAIRGNAGAFKGELKDVIREVVSLDISGRQPKIRKRNNPACAFGYRESIFKKLNGREIIIEAVLRFKPGEKNKIAEAIEEKIKWREERQPLDYPNVGSIFKNIDWRLLPRELANQEAIKKHQKTDPFPILPAACLIDKAGLKGVTFGGAMVSPKHPNFIVNSLQATASEVRGLMTLIKRVVNRQFAVTLEEEVQLV